MQTSEKINLLDYTSEDLKAFFVALGVDPIKYDKVYKSFSLDAKIRKAKQLARKYQIQGTPTFIANRRYKLDNQELGTTEMIEKALKELGWQAERGIDEMMQDTWRWQSNNPNGYK